MADWTCFCFTSKAISIIISLMPGHLLKISKFTVCYTLLVMGKHFAIDNTVSLRQGPKGGLPGALEPWSPEISAVEPGARSFY